MYVLAEETAVRETKADSCSLHQRSSSTNGQEVMHFLHSFDDSFRSYDIAESPTCDAICLARGHVGISVMGFPFPFMKEHSLCNTQFVFCGLEIWGSDLDGDLSCFILRLNDDDGLAAERLRCEGAE